MKFLTDAALIPRLTSEGAIKVHTPGANTLSGHLSLHQGEKEALLLAAKRGKAVLAMDDGKTIKAARFLNMPFIVTPKIVVELFRVQEISFQKARESLEKLGKIGRYSPEIIADALVSLMERKNGQTDNHKDT